MKQLTPEQTTELKRNLLGYLQELMGKNTLESKFKKPQAESEDEDEYRDDEYEHNMLVKAKDAISDALHVQQHEDWDNADEAEQEDQDEGSMRVVATGKAAEDLQSRLKKVLGGKK